MVGLKRGGQFSGARDDAGAAARPAGDESRIDADDLADWSARTVQGLPFGEPDAEASAQMAFQCGVVGLGGSDVGFVQEASVDRQPFSRQRLDLVGHRHMGVEVGVAGAGVTVDEGGGDQALDVDLPDPGLALSAVQGVVLDEGQSISNGVVVGEFDLCRDRRWRDRPKRADRLHGREGQVEPGNGTGARSRVSRDRRPELAGIEGLASLLFAELFEGDLGANSGLDLWRRHLSVEARDPLGDLDLEPGDVARVDQEGGTKPRDGRAVPFGEVRPSQRRGEPLRERVQPFAVQSLHLVGGDLIPRREPQYPRHPAPDPLARSLTALGVVGRKRYPGVASAVVGGDLLGEVGVTSASREFVETHRHDHPKPGWRAPRSRHDAGRDPGCMRCETRGCDVRGAAVLRADHARGATVVRLARS